MCFDDGEPATIYEENIVFCRKQTKCSACRKEIVPKEQYTNAKFLFEGHWGGWKLCNLCSQNRLNIAIKELEHGCIWRDAWCPLEDLKDYVEDNAFEIQAATEFVDLKALYTNLVNLDKRLRDEKWGHNLKVNEYGFI